MVNVFLLIHCVLVTSTISNKDRSFEIYFMSVHLITSTGLSVLRRGDGSYLSLSFHSTWYGTGCTQKDLYN